MAKGNWIILNNDIDFCWYTRKIDVDHRYEYEHRGIPSTYPCKVSSQLDSRPNGIDIYDHYFLYKKEIICEKCGHKSMVWEDEYEV